MEIFKYSLNISGNSTKFEIFLFRNLNWNKFLLVQLEIQWKIELFAVEAVCCTPLITKFCNRVVTVRHGTADFHKKNIFFNNIFLLANAFYFFCCSFSLVKHFFLLIPGKFIIELIIFKTRSLKIFFLSSLLRVEPREEIRRVEWFIALKNSTHNNFILQFFTHAADNSAWER